MEKGSFQNSELRSLALSESAAIQNDESQEDFASYPPLSQTRNSKHRILDFIDLPKDVRNSSTVDSLINQNEDLMARLSVTMRRMQAIEDENKSLIQNLGEQKRSNSVLSDQLLIRKEKEKVWKRRTDQAGAELQVFQERFPDYQKMESQIDRLKRYQERVKSTIKPYLQQLKDYAQSLHGEIQALNSDLAAKESRMFSLENQLTGLKEEKEQMARHYEINQNDLVSHFESDKGKMSSEIKALLESNQALQERTQVLDRTLERQDELENLVISLKRNKEEFQSSVQTELEALRSHNRELKLSLTKLELSSQDLLGQKENLQNQIATHLARRDELEEQMTSLRFLWSNKSEENEKLKASLEALEQLNLDLSSKLNELRRIQTECSI